MKFYKQYNISDVINGKYEVLQILKGGMGIVLICADYIQKQILALKTFQSHYFFSEEQVAKFKNEALLWVSMPWHINFVKAYGVLFDQELPFIILEYIPKNPGIGNNLRDYISSNVLSFKDKVKLSIQLCEAMSFISDKSDFIHRDLKPENILVTEDKIAKITDFGISKLREYKLEGEIEDDSFYFSQSGIKGTPSYMSPEQILGNPLHLRSDMFSLGIILYELFSGRHPYISSYQDYSVIKDKILYNKPHPFQIDERNKLPKSLVELVEKCLNKDTFERFSSFAEMAQILHELYIEVFKETYNAKGSINIPKESLYKRYSKASGLIEFGHLDDAQILLEENIIEFPNSWESWYSLALIHQRKKDFEKSKSAFLKAIEINYDDPVLWNSYGILLCEMKNLDESKKALNKALQLNPHYFKAYTNLASVFDEEKKYPEAIKYCEEAIKINPNSDKAWYNRAFYSYLSLDYVKCYESAQKTIELNPNYTKAYFYKALSSYYLFREEEAKESIQIAFSQAPENEAVKYWHNKIIFT